MSELARRIEQLPPERRALIESLRPRRAAIARRVGEAAPLSAAQERMWTLAQLQPGSASWNVAVAVRLEGPLNVAALAQAIAAVVRRHEALRTVVGPDGAARVLAPGAVGPGVAEVAGDAGAAEVARPSASAPDAVAADVAWHSPDEPGGGAPGASGPLDELLNRAARAPFDLARGPLLRAAVLRRGEGEHVVAIVAHHLVADGWSLGVLADEVAAHYEAFAAGRPCALPEPPVQYGDYAAWQRERLADGDDPDRRFWRERARGLRPLDLPTDRARPPVRSGRGATVTVPLDAARVAEVARAAGCSRFMVALAALIALLRRVTGRDDVAVGMLVAGRTRAELERLVGCFVNTVPIRVRLDDDPSFIELCARVRDEVVDASAHQALPFEALAAELRTPRRADAGLARVLCIGEPPRPRLDLPGLRATPLDVDPAGAQADLVVEVRERELALQYDADLFDEPTVAELAAQLRELLAAAPEWPRPRERGPLPPGDAEPRTAPLPAGAAEPRAAPLPAGAGLVDLFARQVADAPDAVCVRDGGRQATRAELDAASNRVAHALLGRGVHTEDRVAVLAHPSLDAAAAILGVLKAGAAWVPLDPRWPARRIAWMLRDSGAAAVITTRDRADRLDAPAVLIDALEAAPSHAPPQRRSHPDAAAYLVYTSGSTGTPKGVVGLHGATLDRLRWGWAEHPYRPHDVCAVRTPLGFVDSVAELLGPLLGGAPCAIVSPAASADPWRLADELATQRVTRLLTVPALLRALLDAVGDLGARLPALELCTSSGEELEPQLAERFHQALPGRTLINLYGSSEVAADVTAARVERRPRRAVTPIGRPRAGVDLRVVDRRGDELPPLAPGEIHVAGRCLARGYHGAPGLTADRFRPAPGGGRAFRTGDRARRRAGGELEFAGRLDAQLQVRGNRVEPAEVERALAAHPAVKAAAVRARGDALSALVVAHAEPPAPEALREFLTERLPEALVPATYATVDALPTTPSGKLDRAALATLDVEPPAHGNQPRTPTEAHVAATWSELLGAAPPTDQDFFVAGGHSLLAARLVARLRERLGVDLGLVDLFEHPTIAAMARLIDARGGPAGRTGGPATIEPHPADLHEPFPLTDTQEAYWVGRDPQLELGGVSSHAYTEVDVHGLAVERLQRALRRLVDRHPMLRAVIGSDGLQRILERVPPYRVAVADLRGLPEPAAQARLTATREQMSHAVHPADRWPLFDVRASLRAPARDRLHVSVDALICDAHSGRILIGELMRLYRDPDADLPPLGITFRDYVLEQRRRHDDRSLAWWRDRIPDLPPGPELPATRAGRRFSRRATELDPQSWSALQNSAAAAKLSRSGVLMAAYAEVLTTWSRRPHYTVSLTVFDRQPWHPDVDAIVGDFTSLTLLEVDHRQPGTFAERARRLQERLWRDLDHRDVSGVRVLREWQAHAGRGAPDAVMPVTFTSVLDPGPPPGAGIPPLGVQSYALTQTPQVRLDHQVAEHDGRLLIAWDAVEGSFPPGVLDAMFAAYRRLLDRLVDDPASWERPVGGLLPAPQKRARRAARARRRAPARTLSEPVVRQARERPRATAVIAEDERLTYGELVARSRELAATLRPGELVGVSTHGGWRQVVAVLATLEAGAAYLPIDPELPAARRRLLAEQGGVRRVLSEETVDRPAGTGAPGGARPDDLAYVIYTSGSTGRPKGVAIEHRAAANTVAAINRRLRLGPRDRVIALSALSFDLSVWDVFGTLAAGAAVVMPGRAGRRDPGHWAQLVAGEGVTVWSSAPPLLELVVERCEGRSGAALEPLRAVMLSGDWIPLDLPGRVRRLAPRARVTSLGGATEASIWSVAYDVGAVDPAWTSIPYGRALPNQSVHLLDGALEPRPDWVAGELYIGGAGLARGYWRDSERAAAAFVRHPRSGVRLYRTGDVARQLPDGNLELLGREDLQVKVSGHRIELSEVEAALSRLRGVRAAAAALTGEPRGRRAIAAYLVAQDGRRPVSELRAELAETLPAYMIPSSYTWLDALPLTRNGKLDRAALPPPAVAGTAALPPPGAPGDGAALERSLAALWAEVLGVPDVPRTASFFELGGTSAVAIRLLARLEAALGVRVPLVSVYESPTVAQLAAAVEQARAAAPPAAPPRAVQPDPARRHEPFPLTDIQHAYWVGRARGTELGGVATHSYLELELEELDPDRLERALRRLVERHDALRTRVRRDGRQEVLPSVPEYRVAYDDLSALEPAAAEARVEAVRERMSHQVFDAGAWPLFEVRAHRLPSGAARLHVSIDLLAADAWSVRILEDELARLYADPDAELPPLGLTFRDYLVAVEGRRGAERDAARAWWERRLPELPPAPALPLAATPAELGAPRFERRAGALDADRWRSLREHAARANVTPSVALCAAYAEVLRRWSGQPRFTINLTTFDRVPLHPDVDRLVGDFTNSTLLAVEGGGSTFASRARELQERLWTCLEHRACSGVEVLRMLRRDPERRGMASMPIVFTSLLLPGLGERPAAAWRARTAHAVTQTPQVLVDHQVSEEDGRLAFVWDHVADAFLPGLVGAMFGAYEELLHALAADAASWEGGAR